MTPVRKEERSWKSERRRRENERSQHYHSHVDTRPLALLTRSHANGSVSRVHVLIELREIVKYGESSGCESELIP